MNGRQRLDGAGKATGPRRRPTMADVARAAGVSPATVSFVLNDRTELGISAATQRRVRDAAGRLGYRPNLLAQALRTSRTRTVGFVTDEIAVKPPAGQTIAGVHEVALRHGSALLIVHATREPRVQRRVLEDLVHRQVDAIVYAVVGTRRLSLPALVAGLPVVLANCYVARNVTPSVLPAEEAGGRAAAGLLLDAGHTRIAYVTGFAGSWATRKRRKGYRLALRRAGVGVDERLVLEGNFRSDSGYELTRRLLRLRRRPTAILCGNDLMAVGAYFAVKEAGLRIPDDISVVGYDDQEDLASYLEPALTTVRLPYLEMGQVAAHHLFEGSVTTMPGRTYIPCPLVVRASVGPPAPKERP